MLDRIESSSGSSWLVCSKGSRGVDARSPGGEEARSAIQRSLCIIVQAQEGDRGESFGDRTRAAVYGSAEESRELSRLLRGNVRSKPSFWPWELLSAVKAKSEGEAEPKRAAIGEARSPEKRAHKESTISKESQSTASAARSYGEADPSMAREGQAKLLTSFALVATGVKEKSSSCEAFSIGKSSQAREL